MSKSSNTLPSFLDQQREKAKISAPDLYRKLGWSKERYWFHTHKGCQFAIEELPRLAGALGIPLPEIKEAYFTFYASSKREQKRRPS